MSELKKYYEVKLAEFETLHKKWVQSNQNLNALYEAKQQIHSVGDIKIDFAAETLDKARKEEKDRNEDLTYKTKALAGYLLDMERYIKKETGEELHGVYNVRGY